MEMNRGDLIPGNDHPLKKRMAVFASIFAAACLWAAFVDPLWAGFIQKFMPPKSPGPKLLMRHIFVFGTSNFLFCLACLKALERLKIFGRVSCSVTKTAAAQGALAASALLAFAVSQWLFYGLDFQFEVNSWSIAGNVFSNFYEEIIFRAFMIPLFFYLFGSIWPSLVFSSLLFAMVHAQYPPFLKLTVFAGGFAFGLSYVRTGNVFAPWLAHQLADTVADAILKL